MTASAPAGKWQHIKEELEAAGWAVTYERVWRARARRAGHIEDGLAGNLDEAFEELEQCTLLDNCEGCP